MNVLVLQHVAVEHPGIFRDFFKADGATLTTIELDDGETIPDLAPFDIMMVMGGPQDVWQTSDYPWLIDEIAAIRKFVVDMQRPFLGICLGHQLLAAAIGGNVAPAATPEVGIMTVLKTEAGTRDPLFVGLPNPLPALQWHGAEVAFIPPTATVLASSKACPIQAFRYGQHAYGLQCHIEITHDTVSDWAAIPAYARSLKAALGPDALDRLGTDAAQHLPGFNRDARTIYNNFRTLVLSSKHVPA